MQYCATCSRSSEKLCRRHTFAAPQLCNAQTCTLTHSVSSVPHAGQPAPAHTVSPPPPPPPEHSQREHTHTHKASICSIASTHSTNSRTDEQSMHARAHAHTRRACLNGDCRRVRHRTPHSGHRLEQRQINARTQRQGTPSSYATAAP